jgi:hypothetical protein
MLYDARKITIMSPVISINESEKSRRSLFHSPMESVLIMSERRISPIERSKRTEKNLFLKTSRNVLIAIGNMGKS